MFIRMNLGLISIAYKLFDPEVSQTALFSKDNPDIIYEHYM